MHWIFVRCGGMFLLSLTATCQVCSVSLKAGLYTYKALERTGKKLALFPSRSLLACVPCMLSCSGVKVSCPGVRGAEGQGKRKGVTARWGLKAAWNERAGRGTRTGYKVWYSRGEMAR